MADLQKRLTHTVTHTRKRADGSSGNRDVEEYFNSSENDQKRPENDIFRFFLLFVISRSGVRVRLPAPIFPQRSKLNMGEFPSGQRGQTVNLLSVTSVVRIHLPPPKIPNIRLDGRDFLILGEGGFERRLQHAGGTLQPPWLFPQKKRVSLCAAGNPKSEEGACENLGDCA